MANQVQVGDRVRYSTIYGLNAGVDQGVVRRIFDGGGMEVEVVGVSPYRRRERVLVRENQLLTEAEFRFAEGLTPAAQIRWQEERERFLRNE